MNDIMTVREVADVLRVHPYTVTGLIREGKLKAFKVSNRYRVTREELEAFMHGQGTEKEETT